MQADSGSVLVNGIFNLVAGQVSVRVITFGLNLITARLLSPEAYGLASVQFHLLNTGIIFLSREGFRRGCQRAAQSDGAISTRKTLALGSLCIPFGACITLAVCWITLWGLKQGVEHDAVHAAAVVMQGVAAFLELSCGPLYILAKVQHQDNVVSVSEAAATIAKGGLTLALLRHSSVPVAIALSWAQIAYAATSTAVYLYVYAPAYLKSRQQLQPADDKAQSVQRSDQAFSQSASTTSQLRHRANTSTPPNTSQQQTSGQPGIAWRQQLKTERLIDAGSLAMCWRFLLQAAVHLLQTEGSKMVLALCESSYNQGVYGLVTNLGSLVVRTIFFPVEEAAFRAFSSPSGNGEQHDRQKMQILALLVRAFTLVGLLALAFGPSYSYVLLRLVYGQRWSNTEAPTALSYYCGYITLLALNGCTEAYVNATADTRQLSKSIRWQTLFSAAQVALSFGLVWRLGAIGLILADSANMGMRIAYSWLFIRQDMQQADVSRWLPSWQSCAACIAATVTVGASNAYFMSQHTSKQTDITLGLQPGFFQHAATHVGVGMGCFAFVVAAMFNGESDFSGQVKLLSSHRKQHRN